MVNWCFVWHGLEVTRHLRHPQLGTKGDMGWGWPLLWFYSRVMSVSCQGHFKVNPDKILNKNMFLQFPYVFGCKGVFHKAAVDTVWMGSLPTRIFGGGGGGTVTTEYMWLGGVIPHSYSGISVFKLVKNEVLHKILGIFCQKLKIQDVQWRPFWIYAKKHIKEKECVTWSLCDRGINAVIMWR